MRNFKIIALVAILAMATTSAFAQVSLDSASPVSPTQRATAGVFTTQVEDSMDVHYYGDVAFEKWAGFVSMDDNMPSIGYAFKPGGLYLGLWYNGNAVRFATSEQETVVSTYSLVDQILTNRATTTTYSTQSIYSNNSIEVLIGVAGMGIKVGFAEDLETRANPNASTTTSENFVGTNITYTNKISSYSFTRGSLTPSVEWGMKIGNISPKVGVDFNIMLDNQMLERKGTQSGNNEVYVMDNGTLVGADRKVTTGHNSDYLLPVVRVGADIALSEKTTVGVTYGFGLGIYDKSYDVYGISGNVKGNYNFQTGGRFADSIVTTTPQTKVTNKNLIMNVTDHSYMGHSIRPTFRHENEIAGVKLGFYAELPVSFDLESSSAQYRKTYNSTKTVYNNASEKDLGNTVILESTASANTTEVTTLRVSPSMAIGAMYPLVANRFSVNAGILINPLSFTNTTTNVSGHNGITKQTETIKDAGDKVISVTETITAGPASTITDSSRVVNTWENFNIWAAAGFVFNFSENMAVDMAVNGGAAGNFELSITDVRLLFSFKF